MRLRVLDAVADVNERQKALPAECVIETFGASLNGRTIAVWGLAFKPGVDDLSEAPSEVVIARLARAGARVIAFDPLAMPAARARFAADPNVSLANDPLDAVEDADALLILTEWPQFKRIDWTEVRARMRQLHVYDGRNICDAAKMAALGFRYRGVGRRPTSANARDTQPARADPLAQMRGNRAAGVADVREAIAAASPNASEHPGGSND
jgi:UDPglucose 6-dehydrogenase